MAVKLAKALGAEVVVFTSTKEKVEEAAKLGATGVYEKDEDAVKAHKASFHFILSTVSEKSDFSPFMPLLKRDASLIIMGALEKLEPFNNMEMAAHRNTVSGSLIGSLKRTQEVLDFSAERGITPDVQMISIGEINDAHKKVKDGEVRFRYVIDIASLKQELAAA